MEPDTPGLYTPAVVEGVVYVGGDGGDVYALDAASGEERWKTTVGRTWSTPAVADGDVYVQTMDGVLACLDRESGDVRWHSSTPASWCSPVVAGDLVHVAADELWFEMHENRRLNSQLSADLQAERPVRKNRGRPPR